MLAGENQDWTKRIEALLERNVDGFHGESKIPEKISDLEVTSRRQLQFVVLKHAIRILGWSNCAEARLFRESRASLRKGTPVRLLTNGRRRSVH
jgi:hypothetical protein